MKRVRFTLNLNRLLPFTGLPFVEWGTPSYTLSRPTWVWRTYGFWIFYLEVRDAEPARERPF